VSPRPAVACDVCQERENETAHKLRAAWAHCRFSKRHSELAIPLDTGHLRLMYRKVVHAPPTIPAGGLFVHGVVAQAGLRQEPAGCRRAACLAGEDSYPSKKILRATTNGTLRFPPMLPRLAADTGLTAPGTCCRESATTRSCGFFLRLAGTGRYPVHFYDELKHHPLNPVRERLGTADAIQPAARFETAGA